MNYGGLKTPKRVKNIVQVVNHAGLVLGRLEDLKISTTLGQVKHTIAL